MKYFFLFSLITLIITSCNPKEQEIRTSETVYLSINPRNLPPLAKLSDVIESVSIIPLETNSACYLNGIVRTFVGKNNIIVLSPGSMQYLFLFTKNGKFVRKIGQPGKGPAEYSDIRDVSINEEKEEVYMSTGRHGEMITYSFDGRFIERIKGLDGAQESKRISSHQIAYKTGTDFELKVVDIVNGETRSFIPIVPETRSVSANFSGSMHSGYFYLATGKDTIWKFENDTIKPALVMDLGSGKMNPKEYLLASWSQEGLPPGKLIPEGLPFYCSGYYNFMLEREQPNGGYTTFHILVSEKTNESWHFTYDPKCDDIFFSEVIFFQSAAISGELTAVANPHELIEALPKIQANSNFEYSPALIEQIKNLKIDDNPVIVLYTLK